MKKKQFKQIKNEQGRSMIEMLGVLAIIGVLSVGSLSGYEYATASYRAGQIRDALLAAKKSASVNTSASYANEIGRLLKGYLPLYGVSVDAMSSGQHPYQVQLKGVAPRTCTHLWEMKNVLDSFSITMTNPTSKNGCQLDNASVDTVSMSFEFNALDNKTDGGSSSPSSGCTGNEDCGAGYCQAGVCVDCRTSADCSADQVCDEQTGRCTDDCSKGVCQTGHCINHRCGECAEPTPKWDGKNCVACPPSAPKWTGSDCVSCPSSTPKWTGEDCVPCPDNTTWDGVDCEAIQTETKTKQSCQHGHLTQSGNDKAYCYCDGDWGGKDCSIENACTDYRHGWWRNSSDDGPGSCSCNSGWCGADCSQCTEEQVCKCEEDGHGLWCGSFCNCNPGWKGDDCNTVACSGHGWWSDNGVHCYQCTDGFGGPNCETENKCNGNGTWYNRSDGTGYCSCATSWKGTYCETVACNGHGHWDSYSNYCSSCTNGFGGTNCETENKCNGNGTWYNKSDGTGYCSCTTGWKGTYCETVACNGHGKWSTYSNNCSSCTDGFGGPNCETENKCNGNGTWYNRSDGTGYCSCRSGWYGTYCDRCNGHGRGFDATTGICKCYSGWWSGDDCENEE